MSLPAVKYMRDTKEAKQNKTNIGVIYVLTAKVGDIVERTREGENKRTRKELTSCV